MNYEELEREPFIFDSPVEFVLVGTTGSNRSVVAKSQSAQIDLLAYAQRDEEDDDLGFAPLPFSFIFPSQLQPISADSYPLRNSVGEEFDRRLSEYTLVWRGVAGTGAMKRIENELRLRAADIGQAIGEGSHSRLEWHLAPIIDRCHRTTLLLCQRRLRFVYAFFFTMLIYAIGIVYFVVRHRL